MRAISGLWRWRHNPLRRTTDLVESWTALTALLLVLVVAPVTGVLAGTAAQQTLQQSVRDQHRTRYEVTATVVKELNRPEPDPELSPGQTMRTRVLAAWTAPDGTRRHGPVPTTLKDPKPDETFALWTDAHGTPVPRPLDPTAAATHAALAGVGAALLTAGLVEAVRRLVLRRLVRLRYAQWDRAWERMGPDWGRTGTGI
ncbi:Rv1733c family protein [Streptomyces thermoalcalitolerans]|uniref:Uncharacterized protein n=1 Tax=Streptomyces thermoalcalitolerans TaxID=65605 RepID=A0ABN1NJX7_9ACTN